MTILPYVQVTLDTTSPVVSFLGIGLVLPPDDIVVQVFSNEPMGWVNLDFTDSVGQAHDVPFQRVDSRLLLVTIPTTIISIGEGTFRAVITDLVGNLSVATRTIIVGDIRSFDVVMTIERPFYVDEGVYHSYDVTTEIGKD